MSVPPATTNFGFWILDFGLAEAREVRRSAMLLKDSGTTLFSINESREPPRPPKAVATPPSEGGEPSRFWILDFGFWIAGERAKSSAEGVAIPASEGEEFFLVSESPVSFIASQRLAAARSIDLYPVQRHILPSIDETA